MKDSSFREGSQSRWNWLFLAGIGLIFLAWWIASLLVHVPLVLPSPWYVILAFLDMLKDGSAFALLLSTFSKAIVGLGIAFAFGVPLGMISGISKTADELLKPFMMVVRSMPVVSWLASAILLWGMGWMTPTFIVAVSLFPVISFNVAEGVRSVDLLLVEMARVYRVPKKRIIVDIYLGSLVPFVLSAFKVSIGTMWKVAIVAEYLAGNKGIGVELSWAKFYLNTPKVFAYTLLAVLAGLSLEKVFEFLWEVYGKRWRISPETH